MVNLLIGRFVFHATKTFRLSLRSRVKLYLFFNRKAKKNIIRKGQKKLVVNSEETWGEYYKRIYNKIPDFAKHPSNGFYRNLDEVRVEPDIAGIIKKEEEKYIGLLERNRQKIKKEYSDVTKLNGKVLAKLHHTYGCDPAMVEEVLDVFLPEQLHQEYLVEYNKHRLTGGKKRNENRII